MKLGGGGVGRRRCW